VIYFPGILRNRLRIDLLETATESQLRGILKDVLEIYREYISRMDQVYEWGWDGAPLMLQIDAPTREELVPPIPGVTSTSNQAMAVIRLQEGPDGTATFRGGYNCFPALR
jgi:hypothetical protein